MNHVTRKTSRWKADSFFGEEGQFQFQPAESVSVERGVQKDTMYLSMEGLRRFDEEKGLGK